MYVWCAVTYVCGSGCALPDTGAWVAGIAPIPHGIGPFADAGGVPIETSMGRCVCVPDDSLPPLAWLLLVALPTISVGIACGGVESLDCLRHHSCEWSFGKVIISRTRALVLTVMCRPRGVREP